MDEVLTIEIMETVLVGIVGVGPMIELVSRGVLHSILIMSILEDVRTHGMTKGKGLIQYSSSLYMKGVMAQP